MSEVIAVASGKGGVGKTFFSINLSTALAKLGKKVLLIDANLTTPNIAVNLKLPEFSRTIHHVLKDEASVREVIVYSDYGFDVVPASVSLNDLIGTDPEKLQQEIYDVSGLYDFIILDTSAGLGRETISAIKPAEKVIVVTLPEKAALVDAYKVIKLSEALMVPIQGVVVNRAQKNISILDIEAYLGKPVLGVLPESSLVRKSLEEGVPLAIRNPDSRVSIEIMKIASKLAGVEYKEKIPERSSFLEKILKLFKR